MAGGKKGETEGGARPLAVADEVASPDPKEPLHLVLDDIQDYAVFLVGLDGNIASWNRGAQRVKLYSTEEAVGQPFAMLFTPEDVAAGKPDKEMRIALE